MFDPNFTSSDWGDGSFNNGELCHNPESVPPLFYAGQNIALVDQTPGRSCKLCYTYDGLGFNTTIGVGRFPQIDGSGTQVGWLGGPETNSWGLTAGSINYNGTSVGAGDQIEAGQEVCAEVRTLPDGTRTILFLVDNVIYVEIPAPAGEDLYLGITVRNGNCVTPELRKALILEDDPDIDCAASSWSKPN